MDTPAKFTLGEVAIMTGVERATVKSWRDRGLLPSTDAPDGERVWQRFTLLDVCRVRLLRALTDAGMQVGAAVEQLTDDFCYALASQCHRYLKPDYSEQFAVIARLAGDEGRYLRLCCFDLGDLTEIQHHQPRIQFEAMLVLPLGALALDLISHGVLD